MPLIAAGAFFVLSVILGVGVGGCGALREDARLPQLTIAFQEWVGYGLFYLARDKGFFRDEGVDVVIIDEQLAAARRDALRQGILDCEAGTIDLLLFARAEDIPVQAVMELDVSYGADGVVAVKEISSVAALAGKRVVLARNDVGEMFLSYLLEQNAVPYDAVTLVPASPDQVAEAFMRGDADAAVTWEPELSRALGRAGAHILVTTRDVPGVIVDTLNVREEVVRQRPADVRALMRGWFKALAYYNAHPEEASAVIAKYYRLTPDKYRQAVEGLRWIEYGAQRDPARWASLKEVFAALAGIKYRHKQISRKPDAAAAVRPSLLEGLR